MSIKEAIEKKDVKPMTNVHGTPVVTFEEQRNLSQDVIMGNQYGKGDFKLGLHEYNADGTVRRSRYHTAAFNEDRFYDNRYKVVEGKLYLVTAQTTDGYRVITEQESGRVAYKQIAAYVFRRDDKKLIYDSTVMISDNEFITEFTHKLSKEAMKEILPLIPAESGIVEEQLPI